MRRYLILTASMGDGHVRVADELRRRLIARGDAAEVVDILGVLPFRLGPMLRGGYSAMLGHTPWLYDLIYREFFVPGRGGGRPDPLVAASAPAVARLIDRRQPDVVVSTFHLCGQIVGRLRSRGRLAAPAVVMVSDFVAHRMWSHPGNDGFVCLTAKAAAELAARTGRPALSAAPLVRQAFLDPGDPNEARARARARDELHVTAHQSVALVSAGAWGTGDVVSAVRDIAATEHVTVVMCGRNERLRELLLRQRQFSAHTRILGWRNDVADLMRASDVLIDNAAGQTAIEALAVGLPVIGFRPLPGHGRDNVRMMHELGLSIVATDGSDVRRAITRLAHDPPARSAQVDAGADLFKADPVDALDFLTTPNRRPATTSTARRRRR